MPKLTDTQLVILTAAAQRNDGAVLPLPKTLEAGNAAASNTLRSLIKRGLIAERQAQAKEAIWRETGDLRLALLITDAGLTAIGIDPMETAADASLEATTNAKPGKQSILVDLLSRNDGASIGELSIALGWQAHSVRGAIAGTIKKKLGLVVISEKLPKRGRVYRISREA